MNAIARLEPSGSPETSIDTLARLRRHFPPEIQALTQWAVAAADKAPQAIIRGKLINVSVNCPSQWMTFEQAVEVALARQDTVTKHTTSDGVEVTQTGFDLGFILNEADPFACIDLDVKDATTTPDKPDKWTTPEQHALHATIMLHAESYTERSRSGKGAHIWLRAEVGRGKRSKDMAELYDRQRFIICTGDVVHDLPVAERHEFIRNMASQMHSDAAPDVDLRPDDPDDDLGCCIAALALESEGELRRLMEGDWEGRHYQSHSEADFALLKILASLTESNAACREAFRLSKLSKRKDKPDKYTDKHLNMTLRNARARLEADALQSEHIRQMVESWGWTEPPPAPEAPALSDEDKLLLSTSDNVPKFNLEIAMSTDTADLTLDYLLDPWFPAGQVVGFCGRGSTAKSSFLASAAAHISATASTLWVSVEEPVTWIKARHIACGGAKGTLAVFKAVESKRDKQGRVVASSFNILEHLEDLILQASADLAREHSPPLRLVVLDTAVGLTAWGKGESPNDDAAVKKLLAHLQAWAEKYNLTIAFIAHANKGNHEHLADNVMGAAAWTNSPRLSFIHAEDQREDYAYVIRVAKSNLVTFGAPYRTEPVHTLKKRENGPDSVLVKVVPGDIVWGSLDSMKMFLDATKKPREDDEDGGYSGTAPKPPKAHEVFLEALEQLVQQVAVGEAVTREQVEQRVGKSLDRARWLKVHLGLFGHPGITIETGENNKTMYRRTG